MGSSLLPEFDQEMANTRKVLERVPVDKPDYKPHPKSMAMGRLASHTAELPTWINSTLELEVLELDGNWAPYEADSREALLANFDKSVASAREALSKVTDEHMLKTWTMKFGGKEIMALPRIAVLRGVVLNHMIHHRAQLGVYLRLNDVEVPGMYGPSADEMQYWKP